MFKRKHKNIPRNAPTKLWFKKSFDFVVPYSLEDYCAYIETFDEGWFNSYQVYLTSLDQKRIAFNVSKSAGRSGTVWAVGYLQAVEPQSTRVVGKTGVPKFDILLRIILLGIVGFIPALDVYLSYGLEAACFVGGVIAIILLITGGSLWLTRDDLIDKIINT